MAITFTCCVEYGGLEEGTIRLAESLRRFGGEYAGSRIIAVTPRRGPSLRPATLRRFDELGVEYLRRTPPNRYAWMPYLNKAYALDAAAALTSDETLAWVDSDVLVLRPPTELELTPGEDFAACPRDKNVGSSGPEDEFEPYWRRMCDYLDVDIDSLPWVTTAADGARIRLYWNAGIFAYRPDSGFLETWRGCIEKALDRTEEQTLDKMFWVDQVALGIAAVKHPMRYRNLPGALNYGIATHFKDHVSPEGLAGATLLHYHDSMRPQNWEWLLRQLAQTRPDVHAWLEPLGPIEESRDLARGAVRDTYRAVRQVRRRAWSRTHGAGVLGS